MLPASSYLVRPCMNAFKFTTKPNADFPVLCGLIHEATGLRVADFSDRQSNKLTPERKLETCYEAFAGLQPFSYNPMIASHLFFSGLLAAPESDTPVILAAASELAAISIPSRVRGVSLTLMSGTLAGWSAFLVAGAAHPDQGVAAAIDAVRSEFVTQGYQVNTPKRIS
jgi:hypothetical protein